MFRIHREGYASLLISAVVLALLLTLSALYLPVLFWPVLVLSLVLFALVLQFFRNPFRPVAKLDNQLVYAPADGKVVVIEVTEEPEYLKDRRQQVSIFMSPLNVHVNRNPFAGVVQYYRYHPGKYLVAWHPKSSTENERTTTVLHNGKHPVLIRQIAGAVARRIVNYLNEGQRVEQGTEMGFIKFGSRVDLFLPLDAEVLVQPGQVVRGNVDVIARLK